MGLLDRLREGEALGLGLGLDLDRSDVGAFHSPLDTTAPKGRGFLEIRGAFAEMERNMVRRQ